MSFVELVTEAVPSLPPELPNTGRSPKRDELAPPELCTRRPALLAELALPGGAVFGKRSEQTPPPPDAAQMDLEPQSGEEAIESAPPPPPDKPQGGSRKGRKTRAALLPDHLPVEEPRSLAGTGTDCDVGAARRALPP